MNLGSGAVGVSCQKYTNSAVFSATFVFERRFSKKCFFFLELHVMSRSLRTRSVRAIAVSESRGHGGKDRN